MSYKRVSSFFLTFVLAFITFAQMPEYYSDNLDGKKSKELKNTLHQLLKEHVRIPYGSSYGATWTVFRKSDVRPDGSIWDMYSNTKRNFPNGNTGSNHEMNIEHSAPKSWWGEGTNSYNFSYDASFDLHHLVPSDASANMAKSNYILGEVEDAVFNNGVSKVGTAYIGSQSTTAFEPADEYKGDFARMYFYVVTCYQDYGWASSGTKMFQNNAYPTLTDYAKDLLLKWHRKDPVSQKEIDRNNAVYSFQFNRNPYIDYPDLVEYIWGNEVGQEFYLNDTPHLLNYKSDDVIDLPDMKIGMPGHVTIHLQGKNINSGVSLNTNKDVFMIRPADLTASQLNKGIDVEISCLPSASGWQYGTLQISGGGLQTIELQLRGLSVPEKIERIYPVGLKAVYQATDASVVLRLNVDDQHSIIWSGDGVSLQNGTYIFDPVKAGVGVHYLNWAYMDIQGKVKITIK